MTITETFKQYNAFLKNIDLSICAENSDEELVIRLWAHCIAKSSDNVIRYKDHIPRWSGPGNYELGLALDKTMETNQVIRAVIAHSEILKMVEAGQDARKLKTPTQYVKTGSAIWSFGMAIFLKLNLSLHREMLLEDKQCN